MDCRSAVNFDITALQHVPPYQLNYVVIFSSIVFIVGFSSFLSLECCHFFTRFIPIKYPNIIFDTHIWSIDLCECLIVIKGMSVDERKNIEQK